MSVVEWADVFEIAPLVGSKGQVTGVDVSAAMIDEARRRAEGRGLPVSFEVGDSQALRFDTSTFDAVRTERMLMHVPDAELALSEMARVLKPGGRMSVFDFDWETQFCDSPHKDTTRRITTVPLRWVEERVDRQDPASSLQNERDARSHR